MDEPTTHHSDTDPIAAQLRRYANAAERTVPPRATIDTTISHRRSLRPWLAAAAVVALLGGALATYAVTRDGGDALQTVDESPTETSIDLEDGCPAPRVDGPRIDDLRVLLPQVGSAEARSTVGEDGDVTATWIEVGDSDVRSMVWGAPTAPDTLDGGEPTTVEICDPFSGSATRTRVPAAWHRDEDDRLRLEVVLSGGPELHWSVTATTALGGAVTDDELATARSELRRLVAGMLWPAPVEELRRDDVCASEPVVSVGGHELLAVPDGYRVGEPEDVDTGAVDMGGEQWTRLPLLGPDGAQIDVVSISTARFSEALANSAVGTEPGSRTIRRCRTAAVVGGEDASTGTLEVTEIRQAPERLVIGAQEWEYGGWMVIGTGGATEEDVIATAEALRS
jgi:hypothetical protein